MRRYQSLLATLLLGPTLAACAGLGSGRDAPHAARITCQDGTSVSTPIVRVQADGVHLRVDNRTGADRMIYMQQGSRTRNLLEAPPGRSETVSIEAPGMWQVVCSPPPIYPDEASPWVELEIVDPEGLWVVDRPDCDDVLSTHADYFDDVPRGVRGDPLELARRALPGELADPQPGDVVEPAGYPDAYPPRFRLIRDGRVVAVAWYRGDERGGWLYGGMDYCEE